MMLRRLCTLAKADASLPLAHSCRCVSRHVQWVDEFKKFAPALNVCAYYGDGKKKSQALASLRDVDVLIATPHAALPENFLDRVTAHRLVIDEAHLLTGGSTTASKLGTLSHYRAGLVWLVTGTPFSTSLRQLTSQAQLLGQYDSGVRLCEIHSGIWKANVRWPPQPGDQLYQLYTQYANGYHYNYMTGRAYTDEENEERLRPKDDMPNDMAVDRLRSVMIRHTKKMRSASAFPPH